MAVSQQPAFTPICYLTEAMFRGGNDLYRQAIKSAPNAEGVYHRWGNALLGANRYEAAIDKYKKAIEIKNTSARAVN
jgi:tetratricopeptide (TPR) repeat protein